MAAPADLSSQTYQQSDRFDEKAHAVDADNRLLWRMPLKRMDAETLRDSILFVTGKLISSIAAARALLLQKKRRRGGSYIYAALDNDGPEVWRRAVYRFVVRGGERIMLDSFDCPDPSVATPQRSVSNTPVQALTLLNNDFVLQQAGFLRRAYRERRILSIALTICCMARADRAGTCRSGYSFYRSEPLAAYCRVLVQFERVCLCPVS